MSYFVYIISNDRHTVFYTGVTNDLDRRIYEHKSKLKGGFTSKYNCHQLLYYEEFPFINEAILREKQLKKFRREWKFQLIDRMNPDWIDLSEGW